MSQAIELQGVAKRYRRVGAGYRLRTLKSALLGRSLTGGLAPEETIQALDGVSFTVERGEAFGIIGANGSGKSTLLKLIAGMLQPDAGRVTVDGKVVSLIELGAGFHPEISGRENVFINAAMFGLARREVEGLYDRIVDFSGLEDFIDEPVKNYSSGMYVRLGFAVAVHTDPDVLLVDEVLAVGDEAFSHRCVRRIEELLAKGTTLLLVSHALDLVESLCDRALWLDRGRQRLVGPPRRVVGAYRQATAEAEGTAHSQALEEAAGAEAEPDPQSRRWGTGEAKIVEPRLVDGDGRERYHFETGEPWCVEFRVEPTRPLEDFVFGVAVTTPRGLECWGTNTELEGMVPGRMRGVVTVRVSCPALRLAAGEYTVDLAVQRRDGAAYDYRRGVVDFTVHSADRGVGVYSPERRWGFDGDLEWRRGPAGG